MGFPSSVTAHFAKFIITIGCMKLLGNNYGKATTWSFCAFQILLSHSILGTLRFGTSFLTPATNIAKWLRTLYDWYSKIVDVLPLALFTAGILQEYGISEKVWLTVFSLGILPIFFHLQPKQKESLIRRHQLLINITTILQLLMITLVGLKNNNYNVISLIVSYIFERFFIDEFCYYYDIPSTDLAQYCLCFIEIFTVLTIYDV